MLKRLRFLLVFVLFIPLTTTIQMPAKKGYDIQVTSKKMQNYNLERIIVKFKTGISPSAIESVHSKLGTKILLESIMIPGLQLAKIPQNTDVPKIVEMFKKETIVQYAEPDGIAHLTQNYPDDPGFISQWGFDQPSNIDIDAPEAWDVTTGNKDVIVAVIDTGVDYNHEDLALNIWTNPNEILNGMDDDGNGIPDDLHGFNSIATGGGGSGCGGNSNWGDPIDDYGHGTHVSGIIAAAGNNGKGVAGVNWRTKIMACKAFDASGSGFISDTIKCFEYVWWMKTHEHYNIVATNNSWITTGLSAALYEAIKEQMHAGILTIAAAGNDGVNNDLMPYFPASYNLENIIAVAAIGSEGETQFADWASNYGRRTVDLHAPGNNILSTCSYSQYLCLSTPDFPYVTLSGTSMATPHVTGLAALLKAQDSARDWKTIKNLIIAGAKSLQTLTNLSVTEGLLNLNNSLTCSNRKVYSILEPVKNPASGLKDAPLKLAAININCAAGAGTVTVYVYDSGSNLIDTIELMDDGVPPDGAAGDGIYSGNFIPPDGDEYTMNFINQDSISLTTIAIIAAHYDYSYVNEPANNFQWRDISQSGTPLNLDDEDYATVPASFPVYLYGFPYDFITVSSNGALNFDGFLDTASIDCIPSVSYVTKIAPFWDDLDSAPDNEGQIYYGSLAPGPSGQNEFIVSFEGVQRYGGSSPISFQVVFFQDSQDIIFNYLTTNTGDLCAYGACASIGIQGSPTHATQYNCMNSILTDNLAVRWSLSEDAGILGVAPDLLEYGFVPATLTLNTVLSNEANLPLQIDAIDSPAIPQFIIMNLPTLPLTLNPGDHYTMTVEFIPDQANMEYSDSMTIHWSTVSIENGTTMLNLHGWGVHGPDIDSAPSVNYGQLAKCSCKVKPVNVRNAGYEDLVIDDLEIQGTNFSLSAVSLPIIIAPDADANIDVRYCAAGAGAELGRLVIYSNDVDEPMVQILLNGLAPVLEPSASCTGIFSDVGSSNPFCTYIEGLYNAGVVSGCSTIPEYCPSGGVLRDQMAKYIALSTCVPVSGCSGTVFTDVGSSNVFCAYIEAIANAGLVHGCTSTRYCPTSITARDQMAKFICNGMNFVNPGSCAVTGCTGVFTDVTSSNIFCPYVERLYALGITSGCSSNLYCPSLPTSRQAMAKFIINAFD